MQDETVSFYSARDTIYYEKTQILFILGGTFLIFLTRVTL